MQSLGAQAGSGQRGTSTCEDASGRMLADAVGEVAGWRVALGATWAQAKASASGPAILHSTLVL